MKDSNRGFGSSDWRAPALLLAMLAGMASAHGAGVIVSTGYNDGPGEDALPSPWFGSPNTFLVGSTATASAYDPDIDAVLFQNTSNTAVTISALSFAPSNYDLFTLNNQTSSVTVGAGQNVIFLGVDGSDQLNGLQTVNFTLNGISYSYQDVSSGDSAGGALNGKANWSVAETQPWTQIGCAGNCSLPPVPEPMQSTLLLAGLGVLGVSRIRLRR